MKFKADTFRKMVEAMIKRLEEDLRYEETRVYQLEYDRIQPEFQYAVRSINESIERYRNQRDTTKRQIEDAKQGFS